MLRFTYFSIKSLLDQAHNTIQNQDYSYDAPNDVSYDKAWGYCDDHCFTTMPPRLEKVPTTTLYPVPLYFTTRLNYKCCLHKAVLTELTTSRQSRTGKRERQTGKDSTGLYHGLLTHLDILCERN